MKSKKKFNWKNALSTTLITSLLIISALFLETLLAGQHILNVKAAPPETKIFVDPPSIVDQTLTPGKTFTVKINISNVKDLYLWTFYMSWNDPVLNVSTVKRGPFLRSDGGDTYFTRKIYNDESYIYVTETLLAPALGVWGNGTLATVTFLVEATGESPLHFYDTKLLNSFKIDILHTAEDGYFDNRGAAAHMLTVNSDPISGIEFTIDGETQTTSWSGSLAEGSHTIVMPPTWTVGPDVYNFDHWEDASTDPTRIIDLTADMTVTAYYVLAPKYWTLTVSSDPISGVEFTIDSAVHTTPWSDSLVEGTYTIVMPSTWDIYDFDHWEDMSTDPTRTISLTADMTVTAYYVKRQWTLTVNSDPITGIDFTVDGATQTTPWSSLLDEGSYTVVMPLTWTTGTGDVYQFDHWEDTSTNPTRTISLTSDTTVTAYYEYVPETYELIVISDPITGVEFTVDGITQVTPWTGDLTEGSHTIVMPSTWDIYDFDHWEDMSTDPTRVIDLTSDMTITAYYVKRQWTLNVNSDPIDGVEFTLDGVTYTTPWSSKLDEGSYTVVMPSTWTVDTDVYDFDHWEDASTDPTRVISLTSDLSITAYYELAPKYWTLTVNSDPIAGVEFTLDGVSQTTPYSASLIEGSHTIVMPSTWDIYDFDHWEDMSTDPTRTISLTADMTVTAYYVKRQWTLTVNSDPISEIDFTIDDATQTTPWSSLLDEGSYTVVMPLTWTTGAGDVYQFDHWEDTSTNPTRTISLTSDTTVTAYYEYVPETYELTVNSDPVSGVEFTIDEAVQVTPWTGDLAPGSHTIVMPSTWDIYDFDHWEDMSTDPTRVVDLTSDMTVTAYYVKRQWTLNVDSDPISGVEFTLDDVTYVTPWSGLLDEGSHTVVMPSTWFVGDDEYRFVQWEDMSTDPTRVASLTTDTAIVASFEYVPKEFTLTVNSWPIDGIDFTIDDVTHTTNWTGLIPEGLHTIIIPTTWTTPEDDTYQFSHWEDDSTDPTRVIDLTVDTVLTAYYEYVAVTHKLTVDSDPITGVEFTLDGVVHATPWTGDLAEGSYTIVMPTTWTTATDDIYNFDHWEDTSTDPTRTISLTADMTVTAYYVLAPKYRTLTVNSEPISGIEFTIDSAIHATPWSDSLVEGTYTIVMPSTWTVDTDVYNFKHWEDDSTNPTRTISLTEDITITATYELYVPQYGWIEGTVTDADTGLPLEGATVTADGYSDVTDPSGFYSLEVSPGTYTVTASAAGYESQSKPVTVTAGETSTVDFALSPTPFTIDSLIAEVEEFYELGYIDDEDIKVSLLDKLIAAKAKIDKGQIHVAKNILRAFMNHVRAQSGKHITAEAADILIADAEYLLNHL